MYKVHQIFKDQDRRQYNMAEFCSAVGGNKDGIDRLAEFLVQDIQDGRDITPAITVLARWTALEGLIRREGIAVKDQADGCRALWQSILIHCNKIRGIQAKELEGAFRDVFEHIWLDFLAKQSEDPYPIRYSWISNAGRYTIEERRAFLRYVKAVCAAPDRAVDLQDCISQFAQALTSNGGGVYAEDLKYW